MIIVGIDPGTATTGWGIINVDESSGNTKLIARSYGCILTDKGREMQYRLLSIREGIARVIAEYKPDVMAVEQIFFGVNSRTAIAVGQARGAILLAAAEKHLPIFEYTGLTVKLIVAGHGRADKDQVQKAVLRHLRVRKLPVAKSQVGKDVFRFRDDAYDALAIAICHYFKGRANA